MSAKQSILFLLPVLAVGFLAGCGESGTSGSGESDVEVLFNGTDLTGWTGNPDNWSVVDGVIVGTTTDDNPLPYNQFLIWEGAPVEDFELTAELRLTSDGNNSGIQYRAAVREDLGENVVAGYQCDMHPAVWANGMLYDEKGRGILCKRGMKAVITADGKAKVVGELPMEPEFDTNAWSTYKITARGNHLVHEVNGVQTVDVYDHHVEERDLSGVIAFQIHRGPAMKIEIRNVTLKRLDKSEPTPADATPVPSDAPDVNPPKPKPAGKGKAQGNGKGKGGAKAGGKAPAKAKPKAPAKEAPKAPAKAE